MITEDYCSFEVAKLLKEKGFDGVCFRLIREDGEIVERPSQAWNGMTKKQKAEFYLCPTHQMAMKWLREVHKLFIEVHIEQGEKVSYKFMIWDFHIIHPNKYVGGTYDFREEQEGFSTPEQAVEAALKYALENLI